MNVVKQHKALVESIMSTESNKHDMGCYEKLFLDSADKRVENWPLMKDPMMCFILIGIYLYAIYYALPAFMKDRKPYKLKTIIQIYNLFQIISCSLLVYGVYTAGWSDGEIKLGCTPVDYTDRPIAVKMAKQFWWMTMLKAVDFLETVFFVLRKKFSQVSKLHVYHHVTTLLMAWMMTKYIPGGMVSFNIMINCTVHVLMYSYYFLSAVGPEMQRRIVHFKPLITMIQMVQFILAMVQSSYAFYDSCDVPALYPSMLLPHLIFLFYIFGDFYRTNYINKSKNKIE